MSGTILVTGATGSTGSKVVELLAARGLPVRALVHTHDERAERLERLGAEVVVGDLRRLDDVRPALDGASSAYFVYPIRPGLLQATAVFAQAAAEAGDPAVVNMSQISARSDAASTAAQEHWVGERLLSSRLGRVTHLRPTFFAEWLLYFGRSVATGDVLRLPFRGGRHAPIASADQARVIAAVLAEPDPHAGQTYPLFGPTEMDHREIAGVLSSTLGREIAWEPIPYDEFAETLRSRGSTDHLVQHLRHVTVDHENGIFAGTNDLVEKIGGEKPTTLEAFVRDHLGFFTPGGDA